FSRTNPATKTTRGTVRVNPSGNRVSIVPKGKILPEGQKLYIVTVDGRDRFYVKGYDRPFARKLIQKWADEHDKKVKVREVGSLKAINQAMYGGSMRELFYSHDGKSVVEGYAHGTQVRV